MAIEDHTPQYPDNLTMLQQDIGMSRTMISIMPSIDVQGGCLAMSSSLGQIRHWCTLGRMT
jgi:hypothetical protein